MKTAIILSLIFSIGALADVVINDNGTVTKDGKSLNYAGDALLNKAITPAELLAALQTKLEASNAEVRKAQDALADAQASQQRAEAKLKLLVDGAKDALSKRTSVERLEAGNALLAKVTATQTEEERDALLQQQAEIAAKLRALEAK